VRLRALRLPRSAGIGIGPGTAVLRGDRRGDDGGPDRGGGQDRQASEASLGGPDRCALRRATHRTGAL
jgi:hypothetical protein